ncbi:MAG TPA: hypothetical protein VII61_17125 [Ktedonobacteraceae bacterium]
MFTTITIRKNSSSHRMGFWRKGTLSLLILPLLALSFAGWGTHVAHASAPILSLVTSRQQADSAPALALLNQTTILIGWTGRNTAHNLNLMTYTTTTRAFGPAHVLTETTLFGSGLSLATWNGNLYVAWLGTDHRINIGQYNPTNPSHLTQKVTLNERSNNAPSITAFAMPQFDRYLYLSWRGTDGRLNIISTGDGNQFGMKSTYPITIRTSPSLSATYSLVIGWEDTSANSHIAAASYTRYDPLHPSVVTTSSLSQLPVGLTMLYGPPAPRGGPQPYIGIAWRTTGDAHIHVGNFLNGPTMIQLIDTGETTPYGPAITTADGINPLISWTGTDVAHHINIASITLN